ncbi:helix-turn-helix domain-containing protein [Clostridium akagii]|uniref:helix-turn-helix domain-containing protein n=1 Tax=Clostridium akagii TaxID=91623 RepID=UPI000479A4D6|nr:helix-turn-helix domain-containing protein [Clostridium akagii]
MEFPTTGEKVKKLRQQLSIIQEDLISENVTRGLISMIETDRRDVTYKTAVKLAEKFSEKAEELNIILNIDEAYLMRSPKEDAEVYCINKLKNEDITKKALDGIFKLAEEYKLTEVMAKAYCVLGEVNVKEKMFEEACDNYKKAREIYTSINKNEKLGYVYWRLGYFKAEALKYDAAIEYYQLSQYYCSEYDDFNTKKACLYSLANSYEYTNQIDLALDIIERFLSICHEGEDYQLYIFAQGIKANCYDAKKEYDKVIKIYQDTLLKIPDEKNHSLGYIYNNLGLAYCRINNYKESLKYFEMAENFRREFDITKLSHSLIEKSEVFIMKKQYNDAIETIEMGIKYAQQYNDIEYLLNGYNLLAEIYDKINNSENLESIYLNIVGLLKKTENNDRLKNIYEKLSLMYSKQNKISQCEEYLLLSINLGCMEALI